MDKEDKIAELLKVMAHPLRLRILLLLTQQDKLPAGAIDKRLNCSQVIASHYLIGMSDKGLLSKQRQGRITYYSLVDPSLIKAILSLIIEL